MSLSPLHGFNRRSVDELVGEGVHMVYDFSMIRGEDWGYWMIDYFLAGINPNIIITAGRKIEDLVIVHEWLHAYEDIILGVPKRFQETKIEWWAKYHLQRDCRIAEHIRGFHEEFGFLSNRGGNTFLKYYTLRGTCLTTQKNYLSNKTPAKNS